MIKHEPNGDVRIEGSIEQVEYEMNDLQMFAASRGQKFYFIGPNPMTDGGYATMGKLTNILTGHLKE